MERDKEAQPVLGLDSLSRTEWVRRSSDSKDMLFSCPKAENQGYIDCSLDQMRSTVLLKQSVHGKRDCEKGGIVIC